MVETIQLVKPPNFLNNMIPNIAHTGHTLLSCDLRPCPQPERGQSIFPTGKGPIHIPNRRGASPYPQPERGQSISPIGKGPVDIPNWKGASP